MLEEELTEIANKNEAAKNLKISLLSFGLIILSEVIFVITVNSFGRGHDKIFMWSLVIIFYALKVGAAIAAIIAFKNSYMALKSYKNNKNYFAIGISILVLLIFIKQVYGRL